MAADAPRKSPFSFTPTTALPGAGPCAVPLPAASSRRTASNVSVPELTLTTDAESLGVGLGLGVPTDLAASPASGAIPSSPNGHSQPSHSRTASAHSRTPSITMSPSTSSVPQLFTPPSSSPSHVSRRHLSKIQDPNFWSALHNFLESQLVIPEAEKEKEDVPLISSINSSPSTTVPSTMDHTRSPSVPRTSHSRTTSLSFRSTAEADVQKIWEDFFVSQKRHLTSSEVARVRDQTGFLGM